MGCYNRISMHGCTDNSEMCTVCGSSSLSLLGFWNLEMLVGLPPTAVSETWCVNIPLPVAPLQSPDECVEPKQCWQ